MLQYRISLNIEHLVYLFYSNTEAKQWLGRVQVTFIFLVGTET